uniref:ChuA Binder H3 n=1 Tax=synthetic construct TaxID=32630 RepID=UPI003D18FC69
AKAEEAKARAAASREAAIAHVRELLKEQSDTPEMAELLRLFEAAEAADPLAAAAIAASYLAIQEYATAPPETAATFEKYAYAAAAEAEASPLPEAKRAAELLRKLLDEAKAKRALEHHHHHH